VVYVVAAAAAAVAVDVVVVAALLRQLLCELTLLSVCKASHISIDVRMSVHF
jgi:hypothetical protein